MHSLVVLVVQVSGTWYCSTCTCTHRLSALAQRTAQLQFERATVAVVLYHFSRTILLVPRILVVWSEEPDRLEPKLPASKGSNNNIEKEPEGGL